MISDQALDRMRADISDPRLGYTIARSVLSENEMQAYLGFCVSFLSKGPRINTRINHDESADYVHPRSEDSFDRTYRLYRFLHNHLQDAEGSLYARILDVRNKIEEPWRAHPQYAAEIGKLQNFNIVTYYVPTLGMQTRHRDHHTPIPFPLLQTLILLTRPGIDFIGGDFILYSNNGRAISSQNDLDLRPGDALFFDKRLEHEVTLTDAVSGGRGRWSLLVGVRAPPVPVPSS